MTRPPYLRRFAAVVIVLIAMAIEFRPVTTERMPVAAIDLSAGDAVSESDVRWLNISKGVIEPVSLPVVLSRMVPAGSPISEADVHPSSIDVPADWLRIELEVPAATPNGATVVAVMSPSLLGRPATGVVTRTPASTGFDAMTTMVAFPPSDAVAVANALADGTVTVLLGR
jgi:hypothetical protein